VRDTTGAQHIITTGNKTEGKLKGVSKVVGRGRKGLVGWESKIEQKKRGVVNTSNAPKEKSLKQELGKVTGKGKIKFMVMTVRE